MQGNETNTEPAPTSTDEEVRARVAKAPLSPFRLPTDTTPTWEVELLLSGGTLFALLQLPSWLNGVFDFWEARAGEGLLFAISFGLIYAKVILYAIVSALIVHLLTRGLWVAAIGLRSVYPGGIRWSTLRHGARFRAAVRAYVPTLKRIVDRSDDFASQMFAVAALLVVTSLFSLAATVLVFGLAWAVSWSFLDGGYLIEIVFVLVALLTLSQLLAVRVDRRAKQRGRGRRSRLAWVSAVLRFQLALPFARLSQALMLVFTSRFGSVRGTVVLVLTMYALIALAVSDGVFERDGARLGPLGAMHGASGEHVINDAHYADRRGGEGNHALLPYIDSARPSDDYLQLVIPFHPRRHPQALQNQCPGALDAVGEAQAAFADAFKRSVIIEDAAAGPLGLEAAERGRQEALSALLGCAAELHSPRLDGTTLTEIELHWLVAADFGQPAFVAQIPLTGLARGRHVIEVQQLPDPPSQIPLGTQPANPAGRPRRIPFWR